MMPRILTLELGEPLSVNKLLRLHWRKRGKLRDRLALQIRAQLPRGWPPLERYRVDAELRLHSLRDPLELGACLKEEVDACILAGAVVDDGPQHLVPGEIRQLVDRKRRGLSLTLTELDRAA
jgi:hypothetical protein